jgi:ankyrin repeat protein
MLELLIANEFQINEQCDNGRNLLHFAAKENLKEVAKYLVEKELVDIFQKDKNGETALDYAKRFKHSDIAEIIKKK